MQQAIVKDILFLQQKSEVAVKSDLYLAQDLQDTLLANQDNCVGLAANMIGVKKRGGWRSCKEEDRLFVSSW